MRALMAVTSWGSSSSSAPASTWSASEARGRSTPQYGQVGSGPQRDPRVTTEEPAEHLEGGEAVLLGGGEVGPVGSQTLGALVAPERAQTFRWIFTILSGRSAELFEKDAQVPRETGDLGLVLGERLGQVEDSRSRTLRLASGARGS